MSEIVQINAILLITKCALIGVPRFFNMTNIVAANPPSDLLVRIWRACFQQIGAQYANCIYWYYNLNLFKLYYFYVIVLLLAAIFAIVSKQFITEGTYMNVNYL